LFDWPGVPDLLAVPFFLRYVDALSQGRGVHRVVREGWVQGCQDQENWTKVVPRCPEAWPHHGMLCYRCQGRSWRLSFAGTCFPPDWNCSSQSFISRSHYIVSLGLQNSNRQLISRGQCLISPFFIYLHCSLAQRLRMSASLRIQSPSSSASSWERYVLHTTFWCLFTCG
jgi:hypothetical protein